MIMRLRLATGLLSVLALSGLVRADERANAPAPAVAEFRDADRALGSIEQEERALEGELSTLGPREAELKRRILIRGRAFYKLVRVGLLPVGGGFSAFIDHAILMERARRGLDTDTGEWQKLTARKLALSHRLDDLATRKAPLQLEREAAVKARALIDEAENRQRAFDLAFQTSTGAGDYVAIYGGGVGPDVPAAPAADSFRGMKGRLPFPIAGRAEIRTVRRPGANGPGLEMFAPAGTPARAVYPGRVAFADQYDTFGQIVILDHGDHFYTLMGNLGSIDVKVGDDLSAGAKIGTVGQGPKGALLYFEVRKNSAPVDPGPWLGL
jgi:murein DD-endopeptidase MepM/ murein hydrolase activator NlpD